MKPTEPGHYPCDYGFGTEIVQIEKVRGVPNGDLYVGFMGTPNWEFLDEFCKKNNVVWGPRIPDWTPEEEVKCH
jgi:hypothetical protein